MVYRHPSVRLTPLCSTILLVCCAVPPAPPAPRWIALFNGRDLEGWTPKLRGLPAGQDPWRTFRVEDGLLKVSYADYEGEFGGRFGHLFHEGEHSHYRLRVEYRFVGEQAPGAPGWAWRNSGVMIHGQTPESMRIEQEFPVSLEVQFLGGDGASPRSTANLCTPGTNVVIGGALVTQHCLDSSSPTFHGDRWVTVEVEVRGGESVRHFVDGAEVFAYEQPQYDPSDADALRLAPEGSLLLESGTISLQAESHPIEFRRVELLPLD